MSGEENSAHGLRQIGHGNTPDRFGGSAFLPVGVVDANELAMSSAGLTQARDGNVNTASRFRQCGGTETRHI